MRELRNTLERAAALSTTDILDLRDGGQGLGVGKTDFSPTPTPQPPASASPATLDELERQHILRVLDETGGNRERAAAILGISARTLYRKLREYETNTKSTGLASEP